MVKALNSVKMTNARKSIITKIDHLISKRKSKLLNELPSVYRFADGIIINFFSEWDDCETNSEIKYRKIINEDSPEEIVLFMFLPKGSYFELKRREHICSITCLSGSVEFDFDGKIRTVSEQKKILVDTNVFQGKALEHSYLLTTNRR